ncbi:hypothetical protein AB0E59_19700 [Lentzea sp. NPDC034063]|uniref:hypothetical protein n=1 Tax=unclassified Lentzea TaxID=2643253 RepID=UPI0033EEB37C
MTGPYGTPESVPGSPVPEESYDEDVEEGPQQPGKPPYGYHDAEALVPPPVSGSID